MNTSPKRCTRYYSAAEFYYFSHSSNCDAILSL